MPSPRFTFASIVFTLSLLFPCSSAHAEAGRAPPRCGVSVAPGNSVLVPANLPAIVASPSSVAEGAQRVTVAAFGGIDGTAEGTSFADEVEKTADPRVRGATLFLPKSTLPEGTTFEAGFDVDCNGIDTSTITRFATKAPSELPTTMGTLTTRAGAPPNGAEIFIDATPELLAFLPVTMFEIETRAGVIVAAQYGGAQLGEGGRIRIVSPATMPLALCEPNTEGTHLESVSLRAHVAGAESDPPPVAFDIAIACTRAAAGTPTSTTTSSSADEDASDAGGCATSPGSPSSIWLSFALGALVVVASRARRSSR